jgi:hypothetical protein
VFTDDLMSPVPNVSLLSWTFSAFLASYPVSLSLSRSNVLMMAPADLDAFKLILPAIFGILNFTIAFWITTTSVMTIQTAQPSRKGSSFKLPSPRHLRDRSLNLSRNVYGNIACVVCYAVAVHFQLMQLHWPAESILMTAPVLLLLHDDGIYLLDKSNEHRRLVIAHAIPSVTLFGFALSHIDSSESLSAALVDFILIGPTIPPFVSKC